MNRISIKKIIRELWMEKNRTLVVLLAIILGSFAVSMMTTAYYVLNGNLKDNYLVTNPASFTVFGKNLDTASIKNISGIKTFEMRKRIMCRIKISENEWHAMWLFVVDDFDNLIINKFTSESGCMPREKKQILIERTANRILEFQKNKNYSINIPRLGTYSSEFIGYSHDPGLAPSWMEGIIYGYVRKDFFNQSELSWLGNELKFVVSERRFDMNHLKEVLLNVKTEMAKSSEIERTEILKPGEHIHESQMGSLMFMLEMFGILTLLLSCFIIVNMISAIMVKQNRQIGIMKAIGATTGKITIIYLSIVIILGVMASLVSVPLGYHSGLAYSKFTASMLNFDIFKTDVPHWIIVLQFSIGILIPVLVTIFPIYRSSNITVQSALNDYGVTENPMKKEKTVQKITGNSNLSNILKFAIRNTFRQKGRLTLTLIVLVLGGAFFITAFNIRASINYTVDTKFDNSTKDIVIYFYKQYSRKQIENELKKSNCAETIDIEGVLRTTFVDDKGLESPQVETRIIRSNSKNYDPEIIKGEWLRENDNGIVLNHAVAANFPNYPVGTKVNLRMNNIVKEFYIKGIVREVLALPTMYVNSVYVNSFMPDSVLHKLTFVKLNSSFRGSPAAANRIIENQLEKSNIDVEFLLRNDQFKARLVDHLVIITAMLIMITALLLVVGGLGMITTMSINIIERKKEIGILRAIGVENRSLYKIFLYEGLLIGFIAWLISVLVSLPLSYFLGNKFFNIFFDTSLNFMISPLGMFFWLIVTILFGFAAVIIPAKNAVRLSVNTVLQYE